MLRKSLKSRFKLDLNTFTCSFAVLAFVVLAIFLVSTPMINPGFSIDKPVVKHAKTMPLANREDALTVAVGKDGSIFFNSEKIWLEQLPGLIRSGISKGAEKKVYIKADARTKAGNVNEVVDALRSAGIENIAFLVEEKRKPSASNEN